MPFQSAGSDDARIHWNQWALIPIALVSSVFAAPYLLTHNFPAIALAVDHAFSLVCHQRSDRSFWLFGAPVAVCSRCLGIYLGAAIGLLLRTSRRVALQLLIATAALNILDWLAEAAGLRGTWMTVRFVLGLVLGATAGLLVSSSMPDAALDPCDDDCGKAIAAGLRIL